MEILYSLICIVLFLLILICVNNTNKSSKITNKPRPTINKSQSLPPKGPKSKRQCLCGYTEICPSQEGICTNLCVGGDDWND